MDEGNQSRSVGHAAVESIQDRVVPLGDVARHDAAHRLERASRQVQRIAVAVLLVVRNGDAAGERQDLEPVTGGRVDRVGLAARIGRNDPSSDRDRLHQRP